MSKKAKGATAPGHGLDPKRLAFVTEYLKDFQPVQAAIRAGYSPRSARTTGQRLIAHPAVQEALKRRAARVLERQEFTADDVLQEAARIAFADVRELFNADGSIKMPAELGASIAKAVASFKVRKNGECEIKLVSKDRGLELLAKYYGLLRERVEVSIDPSRLATLPPDELARVKSEALRAQQILAALGGG